MRRIIELDEDEACRIIAEHIERTDASPIGWDVTCDARVEKADRPYEADRVVVTFTAKQRATSVQR